MRNPFKCVDQTSIAQKGMAMPYLNGSVITGNRAKPVTRNYHGNNSLMIAFCKFEALLCPPNLRQGGRFQGITRAIRNFGQFCKTDYFRIIFRE